MKKTLITLAALAGGTVSALADDISLVSEAFTSQTGSGNITVQNVYDFTNTGVWHLNDPWGGAGFVKLTDTGISLQVGTNMHANDQRSTAAVKIDATQIADTTPVSLTFDCVKTSGWGGTADNTFDLTVQFIGYTATGGATTINTWQTAVDLSTSTGSVASGVTVDLTTSDEFSSYGIIIQGATNDTTTAGGAVVQLQNLTLVTTPEPTTATLSLLALAGLCARRRRK